MYYRKLRERLKKFNLELVEEKTRIISFSRSRKEEKTSFTFLGINFAGEQVESEEMSSKDEQTGKGKSERWQR